MDIAAFVVIWMFCVATHTLFDLKIKPVLNALLEESDLR
jgi:hypothetical protein